MTEILLAIDTATENCSAALQVGDRVYQRVAESPREHSQRLLPFVQELLSEADISLQQLQGLVVGSGPGSFTGVRIAISIAQGLAFSQQLPVYPVNSLQTLAQHAIRSHSGKDGAAHPAIILSSIDARMAEIYYALYENINGIAVPLTEPAVAKPGPELFQQPLAQLQIDQDTVIAGAGTGWDSYHDLLAQSLPGPVNLHPDCRLPEAKDMLSLVQAKQVQAISASELEPLYVRNEVTWKKLPGR
ncbi:tRNA (adenosine(37)-N6)-threonylcarbamoyltransferase complex dimerization subunit type 1 TsaB [Idiomarina seosinensis]|uniref:tRNA (adenosine(37)-N6)-threonylcarbamoyltransferase complex dimerization subunit type 1 TsaB n=1 Tax=Idiomarina seosinensis TaxID=281739 RepID=UPI00384F0CFF